ncbi:MAG: methionyl-tRNA formyltransferase [Burkholderiaceae bacterium]
MKIIFAGTPEFAATALASLHQAGFPIALVLTQPDRPAGRGMQLHPSAVKQFALTHQIPVAQPVSLRLDGKYPQEARQAHELLQATEHDVMVVAAYGLILPPSVLQIPRLGCINIHGSLLPRWRGAAPIHRAIEAGDHETGVTIMQMDQGLDTGAMLLAEKESIRADDTTGSLHDRLAAMGARLIVDALKRLQQGTLTAVPQPAAGVTYAAKISKEEAALDFRLPAHTLARLILAFNPFPGAVASFAGTAIKIWHAQPPTSYTTQQGQPGEILQAGPAGVLVACGEGALLLTELQKPGGKRLPAAEFLKGFPLPAGQRFQTQ